MISKTKLPFTKIIWIIPITYTMLEKAWKKGKPKHAHDFDLFVIGLNDGSVWLELRGTYVFWASRYFLCPKIVGERFRQLASVIEMW
jgi:hypothetical protein